MHRHFADSGLLSHHSYQQFLPDTCNHWNFQSTDCLPQCRIRHLYWSQLHHQRSDRSYLIWSVAYNSDYKHWFLLHLKLQMLLYRYFPRQFLHKQLHYRAILPLLPEDNLWSYHCLLQQSHHWHSHQGYRFLHCLKNQDSVHDNTGSYRHLLPRYHRHTRHCFWHFHSYCSFWWLQFYLYFPPRYRLHCLHRHWHSRIGSRHNEYHHLSHRPLHQRFRGTPALSLPVL